MSKGKGCTISLEEHQRVLKYHLNQLITEIEGKRKKIPKTIEVNDEMFRDIAKAFKIKEQGYNIAIKEIIQTIKESYE